MLLLIPCNKKLLKFAVYWFSWIRPILFPVFISYKKVIKKARIFWCRDSGTHNWGPTRTKFNASSNWIKERPLHKFVRPPSAKQGALHTFVWPQFLNFWKKAQLEHNFRRPQIEARNDPCTILCELKLKQGTTPAQFCATSNWSKERPLHNFERPHSPNQGALHNFVWPQAKNGESTTSQNKADKPEGRHHTRRKVVFL